MTLISRYLFPGTADTGFEHFTPLHGLEVEAVNVVELARAGRAPRDDDARVLHHHARRGPLRAREETLCCVHRSTLLI